MDVEELIKIVMGCAMNIRRHLGPGYLESVYKNAMLVELKKHSLTFEVEKPINVYYDGVLVNFGSEELQFKRKFRVYRKRFS